MAVINSIEVKGFRSLADVKLGLGDLTVLIGPNNAGKTNALDLLKFLSEGAEGKLGDAINARGGMRSLLFSRPDASLTESISVDVEFAPFQEDLGPLKKGEPWHYGFSVAAVREGYAITREEVAGIDLRAELEREAERRRSTTESAHLAAHLAARGQPSAAAGAPVAPERRAAYEPAELAISQARHLAPNSAAWDAAIFSHVVLSRPAAYGYPWLDTRPQAPVRLPQVVRPETLVTPDGSNLASVLYTLQSSGQHEATYNDICASLSAAFPEFQELRFPPEGGDGRILLRWLGKGQRYGRSSFDLSDGTLSFLYLATLLLGPKPSLLICIDEPEVGLHPHAIRLVAEMLQAAAGRAQLVVATHSPILVDGLKPEQVAIVQKAGDGATQFSRLDAEELKEWLKEFSLGELWQMGHYGGRV